MSKALIDVKNMKVHFESGGGFIQTLLKRDGRKVVKAVDGIDVRIEEGEILSLVGESGSGKTTTGKALLNLVDSSSDKMEFWGEPIKFKDRQYMKNFRRSAQMIFQDPYQSLNPRHKILDIVAEPMDVNGLFSNDEERINKVMDALEQAGLTPASEFLNRYPYELSGGQRQRVVIASAMMINPKFVVADEPVSMLDASIRTGILKLMLDLREKNKLAYLFITHDLSLAWLISDRIAIMYLGKIVEIGKAEDIIKNAVHPYTKALIEIMPKPGVAITGPRKVLEGETPNPADVIMGCKFNSRCFYAGERCREEQPEMKEIRPGHFAACFSIEDKFHGGQNDRDNHKKNS